MIPKNWTNKYIIDDQFLEQQDLEYLQSLYDLFDTNSSGWTIFKNDIHPKKIDSRILYSTSGNKKSDVKTIPFNESKFINDNNRIRQIHDKYFPKAKQMLEKLAPKKLKQYKFSNFDIVRTGKDFKFAIHSDQKEKLLSIVCYLSPKENTGTILYKDSLGNNKTIMPWKINRAFTFSRTDDTWHSYEADGKSDRLALIFNLMAETNEKNNKKFKTNKENI